MHCSNLGRPHTRSVFSWTLETGSFCSLGKSHILPNYYETAIITARQKELAPIQEGMSQTNNRSGAGDSRNCSWPDWTYNASILVVQILCCTMQWKGRGRQTLSLLPVIVHSCRLQIWTKGKRSFIIALGSPCSQIWFITEFYCTFLCTQYARCAYPQACS